MTTPHLTIHDLKVQLADIRQRFPALKDDELFVAWFLRAYVTDDETTAVSALVGGAGDQGIDAVHIDDATGLVFVVQGKYRQKLSAKAEPRAEVLTFAALAATLTDADGGTFDTLAEKAEEHTADRLRQARERIVKKGYGLWLYYATLGRCSTDLRQQAAQAVRTARYDAGIEFFDGRRLMGVLRDYLDGVAPPIPTLDLEMERGAGVEVKGNMERYDTHNQVETWVFSMRGDAVASLYQRAGLRLFARNIRGFLGETTEVNRGMVGTLKTQPDHFFYYNNGITILCDSADRVTSKGRDVLRVTNPQVVNGQQTTRVLAAHAKDAARASVLVKVMQVPREPDAGDDGFDNILSRIVAGTNWQNAISPSDLMSNDRTQIEIERHLRKLGYLYLRKRQTKADAKKATGSKGYTAIKKIEFAQAVAGCDLDPVVVRSGKENLFEEGMYKKVFPNADPDYYLPRYWLMRDVSYKSAGHAKRAYAKWLVLGFMWSELWPLVRSSKNNEAFRLMHEWQQWHLLRPLYQSIDLVFAGSIQYYNHYRGKGNEEVDISQFFRNRRGRDKEFRTFWDRSSNKKRAPLTIYMQKLERAIAAYEK